MKKVFLALAAVVLSTGAFAQGAFDQMEWGVKAGLNLANVTKWDGSMKPSIYLGAFAEFRINDYLGIQPEVLYSRQGSYDKIDGTKFWMRMNYLNIPILAKIYLLDELSLDLGPQFGILLNAKMRYKDDDGSGTRDVDDLKNFDVSFPIGLSYRIGNFDISARYVLGLTKVGVPTIGNLPFFGNKDVKKAKNSVIQIGAGYRF